MRYEDMPFALVEFLDSLGVYMESQSITRINSRVWDPHLFQAVIETEKELCEEFDYY